MMSLNYLSVKMRVKWRYFSKCILFDFSCCLGFVVI